MASAHSCVFSRFLACVFSRFYLSSHILRFTTPPLHNPTSHSFRCLSKNLLEQLLLLQTAQMSLGRASHCGALPQEGLPIEGQLQSLIICPYPYLNAIY
jgi:hypothetical protein